VSQGLFPDGAIGTSYFMTNWTPRASNRLGPPPSPSIAAITVEPGTLHLTVSAIPGRSYRVEYKDSLDAPAWIPLVGVHAATTSTLMIDLNIGPEPRRFFRIRLE